MVVPAMAQPKESCECMFAPKAGQWQFDLNFSQGQFFNDLAGLYYLLPSEDGRSMGLGLNVDGIDDNMGLGNANLSSDLSTFVFNTGSLNTNFTINAGVNFKYFITNHLAINLGGTYNVNLQPSKAYVEGEHFGIGEVNVDKIDVSDIPSEVEPGDIFSQKAIQGAVTHRAMATLGADWYFDCKNPRINPYIGAFGLFKIARVEAYYPYTGMKIRTDYAEGEGYPDMKYEEADIYLTPRAGQLIGVGGGLNIGVDYAVSEGLYIGAAISPVQYQYTLMHLQVMDQPAYFAMNHNIAVFRYPQLKIGIRF